MIARRKALSRQRAGWARFARLAALAVEKHDLPYWLHPEWWTYVLGSTRGTDREASEWRLLDRWLALRWRWTVLLCRWRGHRPGVWWYNPAGLEPDMHCKGCGDNLG